MNPPWWYPVSLAALSVVVVGALIAAVWRVAPRAVPRAGVAAAVWLGATAGLAASGLLSFATVPPTMLLLIAALTVATVLFARGGTGLALATELPLGVLVGYQCFRIPVELWLHRGWVEGVFPVQMTYSGLNFDIVTGISALGVAWLVHTGVGGRRLVIAWNLLGLVLLLTIVTIAILSSPAPFRAFEQGPANTYVTGFPGVWLPAVLVQAALLGHLLVFRRLLSPSSPPREPERVASV